jgi:uncharacterized membrane protein HdeD (DUF308 family)
MFVAPGTVPDFAHKISREAAEKVSRNWYLLLLNGLLLIVAGVLIFSIDWSVRSLATFIGALFILEGLTMALTTGIDNRVRQANVFTGLLSVAAGVAIIVWPSPGILAVGIFLGAWLIVVGTITTSGSLAARHFLSDWWMLLILGVAEVALGVLALANPGSTLAAIVTVGGIWAVFVGVMRVILSFEVKNLPKTIDRAFSEPSRNGVSSAAAPRQDRLTPAAS